MSSITRPSLVGRLLAAAYPDGITADQVENSVRITAVLGLVAEAVATGRPFGGIPLALLADASQPARFDVAEPVVEDVDDEPVPFVALSPKKAPLAYGDLPLGILTDGMCGAIAGVSQNAITGARTRRGIDAATAPGGSPPESVYLRRLVDAWGMVRVSQWLTRWPEAERLYGARLRRVVASPRRKTAAKWAKPETTETTETKPESEPEETMPRPKNPKSTIGRIRALLPAARKQLREALPDVPSTTLSNALSSATTYGQIVFDGLVYRLAQAPAPPKPLSIEPDRPGDILGHGASHVPTHRDDPSQSPQVSCHAHGTIALSTCLGWYTDTAAGSRSKRAECVGCAVGAKRRAELAKGAV